jgi:LacI family transcriptional regulator
MAHLLSADPKRFAFFGPGIRDKGVVLDTFAAQGEMDPRVFAYCRAMKDAGRPFEIIAGNPESRSSSRDALKAYIAEHGHPDAIFCFNDEMAVGANRALREIGLRVPDDVLLVGCDGTEEGEYMNPSLSTVVQPIDRICSKAWEVIEKRLNAPDSPRQRVVVNAEFVLRESSTRR